MRSEKEFIKCQFCGVEIESSVNKHRKFCSLKCFGDFKRGKHVVEPIIKKCIFCNIEFESYECDHKLFCSRKCWNESRKKRVVKECEFCNIEFESLKSNNAKFCSRKCQHNSMKVNRELKKCKFCGMEFESYGHFGKVFCSKDCSNKSKQNKKIIKKCDFCNIKFESLTSKNQKFCSPKCYHDFTVGKPNGQKGKIISKETKEKIKKTLTGYKHTEESKQKMSRASKGEKNGFWGKHHTIESGKKMSESRKGEKNSNYHKIFSEETRNKMSINAKKQGLGQLNLGKNHSKESKRKMRLSAIKRIENTKGQINPNYNIEACKFFDELNKKFNLIGLHAEHVGEVYISKLGYWVDYYEPFLNLVIEWNEERHYKNNKLKEREINRQEEIQDLLKCEFINIRQKYFEQEKEFILKRIEKMMETTGILTG
jgi:hypothetical protein